MTSTVSIHGLNKAAVLAALYNASQPLGLGYLDPRSSQPMTVEQAAQHLADAGDDPYFDYLQGRVLKVDLSGDDINPGTYDRDNGNGALARVIANLRTHANATTAA